MKFQQQGTLLRNRRIAAGLTQAKLAKKIGVCGQAISNLERGIAPLPMVKLKRACKILSVGHYEIAAAAFADNRKYFFDEFDEKWRMA